MSTETDTQAAAGGVAQNGGNTLSVTDNRTGRSYEIEVTDGTVRNYLSAAIGKTGARNRAEAIRAAEDRGWL